MPRPRLTLYGQILFWFFLNLALVAVVLFLVLKVQFRVDPRTVLGGRTHDQFKAVASVLSTDLRNAPREEWEEILARYDDAYGVGFSVFRPAGNALIAGDDRVLPTDLRKRLRQDFPPRERGGLPNAGPPRPRDGDPATDNRPPPPPGERRPPRERNGEPPGGPRRPPLEGGAFPGDRDPPPGEREAGPDKTRERVVRVFYIGTGGTPKRYWAAAMVSLGSREYRHPPEAVVVASSAELGGNEVFYDWRPWLWAIVAVLLVSALIWLPFVGRVSRRLRRLTSAAESISEGDFAVEVASQRTDELGRLSRAVQSMADRLDEYVTGQKRFLGDIAHELCSPLARLRMSLGVLENKIPEDERGNLDSLNEEAAELAALVNELLDFSRASIAPKELPLHEIELAPFLEEVTVREGDGARFHLVVPDGMVVKTNRDLLRRALANVVRNAARHAGDAGPVDVVASAKGQETRIEVNDRGPGLPAEWIERIFEPFARPERARTREGGGAGLGLAIAKTCVEGLGGRMRAVNREGGGLSVQIVLGAKLNGSES